MLTHAQRIFAFAASLLSILSLQSASRAADGNPADAEFFEKKVRPLLVEKCLECHGGKDISKNGLKLTSRAAILQGGESGPAAVERKPTESLLVTAINYRDAPRMPPKGKLSDDEIAILTRWVELGLPWPETTKTLTSSRSETTGTEFVVTDEHRKFWSFRPMADPSLPKVKDETWPKTGIDRFLLEKLEAAGLKPSPPADKRTLLRRATYDLIGLPPTGDELQAFEQDQSPEAFAKVVDRLLASPRYGERWGRHWLDVARFADTKDGVLMYGDDRVRPYAYTFRDYVIRAFNEDLPFDRFVHEQLAADRIEPKVEPWHLAAMGFLTLGRMYDNNIPDVIDDQIDTVTRGFLGLTVSCARCHDHKYDPVPTADYYSLYGVFAGSESPLELPLLDKPENFPGYEEFEKKAGPKREEIRKFVDDQFSLLLETNRARIGDYLVHVATTRPDPLETAVFFNSLAPEDLRPPVVGHWRRYIAARAVPEDAVFSLWHELMPLTDVDFAKTAADVVTRWKTRPAGTEKGQANPLVLSAFSAASPANRGEVAKTYGDLFKRVYEESKAAASGTASGAPSPASDAARQQILDVVIAPDSPAFFVKSHTWKHMSRQPKDQYGNLLRDLDKMAVQSSLAPPRGMVLNDSDKPFEPHIFIRGNASRFGPVVPRRFLAVLSPEKRDPFPHGSGRLDLAKAITSPENPLTSRVIVNRVWMHHFGEPLVATPNDFGLRSSPPTHPELLDHLARTFMADGWSLKKLHRRIMLSVAYQQSSQEQASNSTDPENRLLWRAHRRRLDFESMRDSLLAISGRIEHQTGGRPVDIVNDPANRRRTIYGLVDRQSLPALYRAFDFASPDQAAERRPQTTVPQQALFGLNSPFVREQVKSLVARTEVSSVAEPAGKVAALYRLIFLRAPTADEAALALRFLEAPESTDPEKSQLSRWEQLAQVLLLTNEVMFVD